jgi:hypothetical protein
VNDDVVSSVLPEAVLYSYAEQQICQVQWSNQINAGILQSDFGAISTTGPLRYCTYEI